LASEALRIPDCASEEALLLNGAWFRGKRPVDAIVVVDMQVGLLDGAPKQDLQGVIQRNGHTLSDRPHLDAASVIRHHHWVWDDLITNRSVRIVSTGQLIDEGTQIALGQVS
jgi:hypothetical protein